jgi:Arc/MetJ-type ribon-helix-helix transcriptional regulator
MRSNTKSSITLPARELRMVKSLKARLQLASNVEVVREGLRLLQQTTERRALREAYRKASLATRAATRAEIDALDHLSGEGLD